MLRNRLSILRSQFHGNELQVPCGPACKNLTTKECELKQQQAIRGIARDLYDEAPPRIRALQGLRPFICPFDDLIRWIPAKGRMLDIGCGAGLFLGLAGRSRHELRAIGFDADASAIAAAQTMARRYFPNGRIAFQHSAVGDPWPDGPFELVSMIDVLHHIPPPAQRDAIADAYSHVAPDGLFLYKDMADKPYFSAWWNRLHDIVVAKQWIHYRPIGQVQSWLEQAGGQIVQRSTRSMGPYRHEWIIVRRPG